MKLTTSYPSFQYYLVLFIHITVKSWTIRVKFCCFAFILLYMWQLFPKIDLVFVNQLLYRYGASTGAPTEVNIYADVEAAWRYLTDQHGISPERVVLYGQSIGTVPTVDLASRVKVAGVVLHSPLTSGVRVAFPDTKQTWFFDAFPRLIIMLH